MKEDREMSLRCVLLQTAGQCPQELQRTLRLKACATVAELMRWSCAKKIPAINLRPHSCSLHRGNILKKREEEAIIRLKCKEVIWAYDIGLNEIR